LNEEAVGPFHGPCNAVCQMKVVMANRFMSPSPKAHIS
jgi:hypothetical protein